MYFLILYGSWSNLLLFTAAMVGLSDQDMVSFGISADLLAVARLKILV